MHELKYKAMKIGNHRTTGKIEAEKLSIRDLRRISAAFMTILNPTPEAKQKEDGSKLDSGLGLGWGQYRFVSFGPLWFLWDMCEFVNTLACYEIGQEFCYCVEKCWGVWALIRLRRDALGPRVDLMRGGKWAGGPEQGGQWVVWWGRDDRDARADTSAVVERVRTTQRARIPEKQVLHLNNL